MVGFFIMDSIGQAGLLIKFKRGLEARICWSGNRKNNGGI